MLNQSTRHDEISRAQFALSEILNIKTSSRVSLIVVVVYDMKKRCKISLKLEKKSEEFLWSLKKILKILWPFLHQLHSPALCFDLSECEEKFLFCQPLFLLYQDMMWKKGFSVFFSVLLFLLAVTKKEIPSPCTTSTEAWRVERRWMEENGCKTWRRGRYCYSWSCSIYTLHNSVHILRISILYEACSIRTKKMRCKSFSEISSFSIQSFRPSLKL